MCRKSFLIFLLHTCCFPYQHCYNFSLIPLPTSQEDEAAARVREQRLKEYAEKKSKKPGPIAKSSVLLDCKPWDDETDMGVMEKEIRKIHMDGLTWGAGEWLRI